MSVRWNRSIFPLVWGPVGAGSFRGDAQLRAGGLPGLGDVGGSLVREHPLGDDPLPGEPGHGPLENGDGSDGLLIVVDFSVGNTGVVIQDRVNVGGAVSGVFAGAGVAAEVLEFFPPSTLPR